MVEALFPPEKKMQCRGTSSQRISCIQQSRDEATMVLCINMLYCYLLLRFIVWRMLCCYLLLRFIVWRMLYCFFATEVYRVADAVLLFATEVYRVAGG